MQHWWLPRTGAGVRTHDLRRRGLAGLCHRALHRGDRRRRDPRRSSCLSSKGQALGEGEHDAFFTPEISEETATLYEHCARALDLAIKRSGANGLPLILGGDWNDGMNRVGERGQGRERLARLVPAEDAGRLCRRSPKAQGDAKRAQAWTKHADDAEAGAGKQPPGTANGTGAAAIDDGTPLGSHESRRMPDRFDRPVVERALRRGRPGALDHGDGQRRSNMLVDDELKIVKLFTPPFSNTDKDPGYIKSYPPGVRENGGQYTHAATWFVIALAEMGRADDA